MMNDVTFKVTDDDSLRERASERWLCVWVVVVTTSVVNMGDNYVRFIVGVVSRFWILINPGDDVLLSYSTFLSIDYFIPVNIYPHNIATV